MTIRYLMMLAALFYNANLLANSDSNDPNDANDTSDKIVFIQDDVDHDIYLAGTQVTVKANVEGDAVIAGGRITIEKKISEDLIAAGGNLIIDGEVGDDARLAGGQISINGNIIDDAIIAGGSIRFASNSTVGKSAWLAGGSVEFNGRAQDNLVIKAGEAIIAGEILGNVTVYAKRIQVLPTAKIAGDFIYTSAAEADIHQGAEIAGSIKQQPLPDWQASGIETLKSTGITLFILFLLGIVVTACVLYLLFSSMFIVQSETISNRFLQCIAIGLITLLVIPPIIVLLLITVLGIPLSLLLLLLYLILLILAYFAAVFYIGDQLLSYGRRGHEKTTLWRLLFIVAALILLFIVSIIPLIGNLMVFFIFLLGLGSVTFYLLTALGFVNKCENMRAE